MSSDTTSRIPGPPTPVSLPSILSEAEGKEFRAGIYRHFREEGRDFPWRRTRDPWLILNSEIMLQQTRTETVAARWDAWAAAFPSPASLAEAPLAEVLSLWKGLGYNRRALSLRRTAEVLVFRHGGSVPRDETELRSLPGVGPYTARAIRAFAFNLPGVLIETNIRAVYLFYFYPDREKVTDRELEPLVEATLDREDPRTWYYALMDYGAALKKREPNPGRRSAAYSRQSPFEGSHRQVRSAVLHALSSRGPLAAEDLQEAAGRRIGTYAREPGFPERLARVTVELAAEGFLEVRDGIFMLKD